MQIRPHQHQYGHHHISAKPTQPTAGNWGRGLKIPDDAYFPDFQACECRHRPGSGSDILHQLLDMMNALNSLLDGGWAGNTNGRPASTGVAKPQSGRNIGRRSNNGTRMVTHVDGRRYAVGNGQFPLDHTAVIQQRRDSLQHWIDTPASGKYTPERRQQRIDRAQRELGRALGSSGQFADGQVRSTAENLLSTGSQKSK